MTPRGDPGEDAKAGAPWLITWADMMTVLLAFFIVLHAFSTISERKFDAAVRSIQRAFDITLPVPPRWFLPVPTPDPTAAILEEKITEAGLDGVVVQDWGDRIVVSVGSGVLFEKGDAELRAAGRSTLDGVAALLGDTSGLLRIEGHTCDLPVPPGGRWRDNWWLSTARAVTVLEELTERGLPPERLCAVGFGEHLPVAPNDGEANRARNRRVEFVIEKGAGGVDGTTGEGIDP
ncbi:MAG: OmpA/MotB family protein [bacterium]